jgi:polysaccharide export outer membrane protein
MKKLILVTILLFPSVAALADTHFNVLGKVNRQGHFKVDTAVTIIDAIAHAEGFSEQANMRKVVIRRQTEGGVRIIEVNVYEIILGQADNPVLESGDLIYVHEKGVF